MVSALDSYKNVGQAKVAKKNRHIQKQVKVKRCTPKGIWKWGSWLEKKIGKKLASQMSKKKKLAKPERKKNGKNLASQKLAKKKLAIFSEWNTRKSTKQEILK